MTVEGGEAVEAELLLVAVGRGPYTAGLGYEEHRRRPHRGFVTVDEHLQHHRHGVYAVGDIVPGCSSRTAASSRASSSPRTSPGSPPPPIVESGIPRVTYSDPEVASVGLNEATARSTYGDNAVETRLRSTVRCAPSPPSPSSAFSWRT